MKNYTGPEIVCRYCDESTDDKDMIQLPCIKVINGELIKTTMLPAGQKFSEFICLDCLRGEIEAYDGRWPESF